MSTGRKGPTVEATLARVRLVFALGVVIGGLDHWLDPTHHARAVIATVAAIVGLVLATVLAGVYPAWKAGRVNPVESINLV